jgi:hypothetical protein
MQNCLKQDAVLPAIFKFHFEYAIKQGPGKPGKTAN